MCGLILDLRFEPGIKRNLKSDFTNLEGAFPIICRNYSVSKVCIINSWAVDCNYIKQARYSQGKGITFLKMSEFPTFVRSLPEADLPFDGL
ncbi:MAG: hypothetical protein FD147_1709 [Chloroflexi bacterium]|nr:MAG: hypothetical protein FD147_1709 [Chloroflexota bacterium]